MTDISKCPKCSGKMMKGSKENLDRNFACTRPEPDPEVTPRVKIQSYYCTSCGFMEFYRELKTDKRQPPSLIQDADKAMKLHEKEKKG